MAYLELGISQREKGENYVVFIHACLFLMPKYRTQLSKEKHNKEKKSIVRANKWPTISKCLLAQYQAVGSEGEGRIEEGRVKQGWVGQGRAGQGKQRTPLKGASSVKRQN